MVDPSRAPLSGEVEVDETYVGGAVHGKRGWGGVFSPPLVDAGHPPGAVSRKRLQRYLSEFEFRLNRRTSHAPTHLFQRLMEGVVRDSRCSYDAVIGKVLDTGEC